MKLIFLLLITVYLVGYGTAMLINLGYAVLLYDLIMYIVYIVLVFLLLAISSVLFRAVFFDN